MLRLIKFMVAVPGWQRENRQLSADYHLSSLLSLRRLVRPGSLVILLSDFRGFDEKARSHLIGLRQHNEIIMVHIHDPMEAMLPPAGFYRVTDGQKEMQLDTSDGELVQRHRQRFDLHRDKLVATARASHINFLTCRTDDDPEHIIREGLRQR